MGQVRHGSATTTHAIRAAIQDRGAEQGPRHQPEDGGEVAEARDGGGP